MGDDGRVTRRTVLAGAAGAAIAASLPGGTALARGGPHRPPPLWRTAAANGIVFGTAYSTRLSEDADYVDLVDREAALLFTEDDLLWYKLKPTPESDLDFSFADQFMAFAEQHRQLVFGAHLVWDEGFGDGWGDELWYQTIGPTYVAEAFHAARAADPHATLVLNEFGFETDTEFDAAADRRRNALQALRRRRAHRAGRQVRHDVRPLRSLHVAAGGLPARGRRAAAAAAVRRGAAAQARAAGPERRARRRARAPAAVAAAEAVGTTVRRHALGLGGASPR